MKHFLICCLFSISLFSAEAKEEFTEIPDKSDLPLLSPDFALQKRCKIRLQNGLEALLISDAKAEKSAAALSVNVGSWQNPKEHLGMAHFVEHMLFQGSAAYPQEEGFWKYTFDNGGISNAFTAESITLYFFSVNHQSFTGALDRFSHFFIDPLFNFDNVKKELHAVDQEHFKNLENDFRNLYSVRQETSNPENPFYMFATGNSQTLGNVTQTELKKWHEENYSADKMHLVIYSSLPLDELKKIAVEKFKSVPSHTSIAQEITAPMTSSMQTGKITYIEPKTAMKMLSLSWEIPQKYAQDENKVSDLIAYSLTQGNHSLLQKLKNAKLATDLNISPYKLAKNYMFFDVLIELTDQGFKNYKEVVEYVFEAISMLKKDGLPSYIFEEFKTMQQLQYQYQQRQDVANLVMHSAQALCEEELATYPRNTLLPKAYNSENNSSFLEELTPQKCLFTLLGDPKELNIKLDHTQKWTATNYTIQPIDEKELLAWGKAPLNPEIRLAPPNPFLPHNLKLVEATKEGSLDDPLKLVDSEQGKLFFIQDLRNPETAYKINLVSPLLINTVQAAVLADLYIESNTAYLAPLLNTAASAGLNNSLQYKNFALQITFSGYSEKFLGFVRAFLQTLKNSTFTREEFEMYKASLLRGYEIAQKALPYDQAKSFLASLIYDSASLEEKIAALQKISYQDFVAFQSSLYAQTYIMGSLSGNLSAADGQKLWQATQEIIGSKPYPPNTHEKKTILSLLPDGPYKIIKNVSALGNGLILLIELGDYSPKLGAAQETLSQIMQESFFTSLRTRQKTGYIVRCGYQNIEDKLFQFLGVQSGSHGIDDLLCRFDIFLDDFVDNLTTYVPKERFESVKQNLITIYEMPPNNILQTMERINVLATEKKGDFKWLTKHIASFKELSYEDFLQTATDYFSRSNKKRLAVGFAGNIPDERRFAYNNVDVDHLENFAVYGNPSKEEIAKEEATQHEDAKEKKPETL